jgi:IS5 family transposase
MLEHSSLELLDRILYKKLLVVSELYRQQRLMYKQVVHKVEDRIVSIHQPHIRPIVRGKAGADVEFGAKVLIIVQNGFSHVEKIDYNNILKESTCFNPSKRIETSFFQSSSIFGKCAVHKTRLCFYAGDCYI